MTIAAANAKKDIYVEKGLCKTLDEAKQMRKAVHDNNVVLQLGHHYNSLPSFIKAREIYRSGELGKVPLIRTYIDRTGEYPEWQFFGNYDKNVMPKDAGRTQSIGALIANASKRPFDAKRLFLWRYWWEYGNGIAGDLMSHLWDSVNMVAGMGIPESAVTQGALYFWKDGRDVPDMWNVAFDYPKQELAVTFQCTSTTGASVKWRSISGGIKPSRWAHDTATRTAPSGSPSRREITQRGGRRCRPLQTFPSSRKHTPAVRIMRNFIDCARW